VTGFLEYDEGDRNNINKSNPHPDPVKNLIILQ
jgi:hypothetical protein